MEKRSRNKPYQPVQAVKVHLWGRHIGTVALDPTYGYYAFAYTPQCADLGVEPAPLHMPVVADQPYLFTDLPEATYKRLPALLSDALPDDFGNALIDRYMADKGLAAADVSVLDRLAYMGKRAMGALTFQPAHGPRATKPSVIEISDLVEQARALVSGQLNSEDSSQKALRSIIAVGTSAGGARAKAVIAVHPETGEMRSGQLDAPDGFEHWLLKFDGMGADRELGASQHYGRIEYAYHRMARQAGIRMSDCRLHLENGRAHFMTRRFDRLGSKTRHHMQTLCAMAHLDYKKKATNSYAQLFATISQLRLPYEDLEEAFRRMVFNVMGRNCDDHTKNFSFLLRQGHSRWELAPAYDVTFAHNPKGEWTNQHLLAVNGKFRDIQIADLLADADRFGIGSAKRVIAEVRAAIERWHEFAAEASLPQAQTSEIQAHHRLLN
jgi:serine/threonine-protein kinase HipA